MVAIADLEAELLSEVGEVLDNPLLFAQRFYPWGKGQLEESVGPRAWQAEVLAYIRDWVSNPATRFTPCRIAIASGHGIGKSAFMGMVSNWAMSVCEDAKIVVTAGTGTQLSTKTVPEISKWFKLSHNAHWFDVRATSIRSNDPEHALAWRVDFQTWSEHNTEAFAGLHNKGKIIVLIYDEASAIADPVWKVSEGALTDENTIIIWLAYGNPTQNTGAFRECFGKFKHRWKTFQIDSRNVEGTNKEEIAKWIADYGEDSDFVRIRVRGEFPRAGSTQFIAGDVVAACRKYRAIGYSALPKILSVDVARFGDDQSIIGDRQGRKARILGKYRGLSTVQTAERVIEFLKADVYDAVVVDGDGLGAGTIDHLVYRGYGKPNHPNDAPLFEFHGGHEPQDAAMYYNRRAEVWGGMRGWLVAGAEIPDDPELDTDLSSVQYGLAKGKRSNGTIQLESKDDMKSRGLASPDCGDMLAMTFAVDIAKPEPKKASQTRYVYPNQTDDGWMASLCFFMGGPMTGNAYPHYIQPELWVIAFVVVGLWFAKYAASRAMIGPNDATHMNFMEQLTNRLPFARILRVVLLRIGFCDGFVFRVRGAVLRSALLKICAVPFAHFLRMDYLSRLVVGTSPRRPVPLSHVSRFSRPFFRSCHGRILSSDGIGG